MQLHEFTNSNKKRRQRVGRGGKRGTTSGRGQKGQKSRAGRRIRPAERDLLLKIPKRRGFRNKPKKEKPVVFNLYQLLPHLDKAAGSVSPQVLDANFLKKAGLLPQNYRGDVKILGDGEIKMSVTVRGLGVSKSAKEKIEKAGGKVINE